MHERHTIIGEVWRKLGSQGEESQKIWKIVQSQMSTIEPFSVGPSFSGARRSSKVKICDIRFLALLSAQKELTINMCPDFLKDHLPHALSQSSKKTIVFIVIFLENSKNFVIFTKSSNKFGEFLRFLGFSNIFLDFHVFLFF